jgi:hypothetical protein
MNDAEKAEWYAIQIRELAELIEECIDDNNYDEAGAILIDLQDYSSKLDSMLDKLID